MKFNEKPYPVALSHFYPFLPSVYLMLLSSWAGFSFSVRLVTITKCKWRGDHPGTFLLPPQFSQAIAPWLQESPPVFPPLSSDNRKLGRAHSCLASPGLLQVKQTFVGIHLMLLGKRWFWVPRAVRLWTWLWAWRRRGFVIPWCWGLQSGVGEGGNVWVLSSWFWSKAF